MIQEFVPLKALLKALEDNKINGSKDGDYMGFILELNNMIVKKEVDD